MLGEFFRCEYKLKDGVKAMYIAEQVSHHPPVSAYYYTLPELGIFVKGEAHPKAKFLGNSAATIMQGYSRITFSELQNETYEITNPNVYARGILCTLTKKVISHGSYFLFLSRKNGNGNRRSISCTLRLIWFSM